MSSKRPKTRSTSVADALLASLGMLGDQLDRLSRPRQPMIIVAQSNDGSPCYKRTAAEWRQLHAEMIARHNARYPGDENVRNRLYPNAMAAMLAVGDVTLRTVKQRGIVCEY